MTHAELLRSHANLAIKEGGMYYSGECLSRIAATAESLEAENAKLRELVVRMFHTIEWSDRMSDSMYWPSFSYERELRELGVEVDG